MVGKTKLTVRGKSPDDGIHRKKVWKGVDLHDRRSVVLLGFRCSEIMRPREGCAFWNKL